MTDKPYKVVLTHSHMDHIGGMGAFEEVYIHPKDEETARVVDVEEVRTYAEQFGKAGGYQVYDYDPAAIQPIERLPR